MYGQAATDRSGAFSMGYVAMGPREWLLVLALTAGPRVEPCQGNRLGVGRRGRCLGSWERRERHVLRTHAYAEDPALDARDGLLLLLKRWIEIPA
jgi:hypothetical protein